VNNGGPKLCEELVTAEFLQLPKTEF